MVSESASEGGWIKTVTLYPHQKAMLEAPDYLGGIMGGIGCGKTVYLGCELYRWIGTESNRSPVIAVANTHDQIDKAFMAHFKSLLSELEVEFVHGCRPPDEWNVPLRKEYNKFTNILTTETGHIVYTASLDRPDNIRGPEYGLALLDELAFAPDEKGFKVVMGRVRCPHANHRRVRFATSPPPENNWFYETFLSETKMEDVYLIHARTEDNLSLPGEYIDSLKKYYTPEEYDRECGGLFVPRGTNRCYSEYDPHIHLRRWEYVKGQEVILGCDFNRSPLAWVFLQSDARDNLYCFDELFIEREATTIDAAEEAMERYGRDSHLIAYPDFNAGRIQTSAVLGLESDVIIMQNAGMEVVTAFHRNPPQAERVEAVQDRLRAARAEKPENALFLDPDRTKHLQNSLMTTMFKPGTRQIQKSKKTAIAAEHPSDAIGYAIMGYDCDTGIVQLRYVG